MYTIYTTAFDEVIHAKDLFAERIATRPGLEDRLKEDILIKTPQTFSLPKASDTPITLLLDCSGSMRGHAMWRMVAALMAMGDVLTSQNRPFEILGFTTVHWKGGNSRKQWIDSGREPRSPGRLNDLRHIIFKDFQDTWPEARTWLLSALAEGLMKENIDGEALLWATNRISDNGRLVFISDGAPIDDSTLSVNPYTFLEQHLDEVLVTMKDRGVPMSIVSVRDAPEKKKWEASLQFRVPKDHTITDMADTITKAIDAVS